MPMANYLKQFGYAIPAIVLFIIGAVLIYLRRPSTSVKKDRSWIDYLLLWPLILERDANKRDGRFFTKREWIGWGVVVAIIVLAVHYT